MPTFDETIIVTTKDGKRQVRIDSGESQQFPFPPADLSESIILSHGGIFAGDGGKNGRLQLQDSGGRVFVDVAVKPLLIGSEASLTMWNPLHNAESLTIDGRGQIVAGGQGGNGALHLRNMGGADAILLEASHGNIWIGGNGVDGDVVLFPSGATNITDAAQGTIHLDGQSGDIVLQNADCAEEFDVSPSHRVEPGTVMGDQPQHRAEVPGPSGVPPENS